MLFLGPKGPVIHDNQVQIYIYWTGKHATTLLSRLFEQFYPSLSLLIKDVSLQSGIKFMVVFASGKLLLFW